MEETLISTAKAFILLFAIVDPFGNVPVFLAMTAGDNESRRKKTALKACLVSLAVLAVFTVFGEKVLLLFAVSLPAFQVAGGIVLALFSLPMLTAVRAGARILASEEEEGAKKPDVSIVPLAIPLLAGPGAITTVIVLSRESLYPEPHLAVIAVTALVLFLAYIILRFAGRIAGLIGNTGLNVLTRIMGLIILVIAVQFILEGAKAFFAG